jgi:cytoskeletal protein CcmA (bactofilin family)
MALIKTKLAEITSTESIIAEDCIFTGNIVTKGSLRVDGVVDGNISEAKDVFVSKTGKVNGDISSEKCVVYGNVKGNIVVKEKLEIMSSSTIEGDITSPKILVEEGAIFNGNINMKKGV